MPDESTLSDLPPESKAADSQTLSSQAMPPHDNTHTWEAPPLDQTADLPPSAVNDATGEWQSAPAASEATGDWQSQPAVPSDATGEYVPSTGGPTVPEAAPGSSKRSKGLPSAAPPGRFVMKNFHARGGMGEVWVAEDTDIGRVVALKKIRSGREGKIDSFLHEAQITGQLEHPGVVPIHELGIDAEGHPYYVMKFIHGQTLTKAIDEYRAADGKTGVSREVQLLRLLQTFNNLCQTVAYAHSRNVIHRDLKPDNVMVGAYGETLVLDWGLAKILGESMDPETAPSVQLTLSGDTAGTQFGSIKGTPSYMAPEVAEGRTSDVDQISDVYLLGGCLYQILTGKKPRHAPKLAQMIDMARKEVPPEPRKLDPTVPRPLNAICMKALAMRKEDRYQTAQALAEDMQRYLAGEPVSAYRETLVERAWRWMRRHRVLLGRVALAVVVMGLVVYGAMALTALEEQRQADIKAAEDKRLADLEVEAQKRAKVEQAKRVAELEVQRTQREDKAKSDLQNFRKHAEEMHFYNVAYENAKDLEPLFGTARIEHAAQQALQLLEPYGKTLEQWPLGSANKKEDIAVVRRELYEVLLHAAQWQANQDPRPEAARQLLALVERAAALQPSPTMTVYRLRSQAYRALQDLAAATDEHQKANHPQTPRLAIDDYLLGEHLLYQALRADSTEKPGEDFTPQGLLFVKALVQFDSALQKDREMVWAYWQAARCLRSLDKKKEFEQRLSGCVAIAPQSSAGFTIRGLALSIMQHHDEALASMGNALQADPKFRPARLYRGFIYLLMDKNADALADFATVLEPPDSERLLVAAYYRGSVYLKQGNLPAALADFDLVTTGRKSFRDAHIKRARVCFLLDKYEQALDSLQTYLGEGPHPVHNKAEVLALYADQLHVLGIETPPGPARNKYLQHALEACQQLRKMRKDNSKLLADIGMIYHRLGEVPAAVDYYQKALDLKPDAKTRAKILERRGWLWEEMDKPDFERGLQDFAEAIELEPTYAEAHAGYGYMSACLKKQDAALRHANLSLIHGGAGDPGVLHNVACIYAKLSVAEPARQTEFEDMAIDLLQQAIKLWCRKKQGPDPIELIRIEPSFTEALRTRPEFKKLLKPPC